MLVVGWVHLLFFASCFCFPPISWTSTSLSCGCGRTSMDHVVFCIVDSISPAEAWNSHCQHPRCFGQVFPWIFCWQKKKVEGARKMENLWNCCNRKSLLARILSGNMSPWKKKTLHVKQSVSVFESCLSLVAVILGHLPALGIIFPYFNDLHWSRPSRPDNISIIKASPSTQRRLNWGLTKGQ